MSIEALRRILAFVGLILAVASFAGMGPTLVALAIIAIALAILL